MHAVAGIWKMDASANAHDSSRSSRNFASTVENINRQLDADDPVAPVVVATDTKINLYSLSAQQLEGLLVEWGQPKFRAKQLRGWLYDRGVDDFDRMLDLPKDLRTRWANRAIRS